MEQLDDLLAGVDVELSDDLLDRIDAIVPPGGDADRRVIRPARGWRDRGSVRG
jgi:hypothetical protein